MTSPFFNLKLNLLLRALHLFMPFVLIAACTTPMVGNDTHPKRIVLAMAEPEYETDRTLPAFAASVLHARHGYEIIEVGEDSVDSTRLGGFVEAMADADLLIVSIRRRALHPDEMAALRAYLAAGKPLIGIRTTSHAFAPRPPFPEGYATWQDFDGEVLGGNYHNHHGNGLKTTVTLAPGAAGHTILKGVELPFTAHGSLYLNRPLRPAAKELLTGTIEGKASEPVAWTHTYGRSRIFYTSLGHKDDFREPSFIRMMENAVMWAMESQ